MEMLDRTDWPGLVATVRSKALRPEVRDHFLRKHCIGGCCSKFATTSGWSTRLAGPPQRVLGHRHRR